MMLDRRMEFSYHFHKPHKSRSQVLIFEGVVVIVELGGSILISFP